MSAPDSNIQKQERHHRGPLRGMFAGVLFVLVLLAGLGFWAFRGSSSDNGAAEVGSNTSVAMPSNDDDAITADDDAQATRGEADPTAVEVPAEVVTAPQSGMDEEQNPDVGRSDSAEPLNPVEGSGAPAVQGNE